MDENPVSQQRGRGGDVVAMGQQETDIVVVGAGPAGSSAARAAAEGGARVLVLEKSAEIGYPVKTSGGSWIAPLRALGVPAHLYHPIRRARFIAPSREATFEYRDPQACVVDVRGLYQFLAARAGAAGACLRLRTTVSGPLLDGGVVRGVEIREAGGRAGAVHARVVIDASGSVPVVATRAGLQPPPSRLGVGAEYDLYAPNLDPHEVVLVVGRRVAPAGYAWVFPWGAGRARVGVGIIHPDIDVDPFACLDRLFDLPSLRAGLQGAQPLEVHHGVIPAAGTSPRFAADGLLLVGDAGGQASPIVGEGIRFSMLAGLLAGRVAARAVRRGDVSRRALEGFERLWRREYDARMRWAQWINRRIARCSDEMWDHRMALIGRLTPHQFAALLRTDLTAGWLLSVLATNAPARRYAVERIVRAVGRSGG